MIKRFLVLFLPQLIFRALSKEPKALSDVGLCRTPTNRHQPGSGIRTRVPVSEYACVCVCFGEGANPKFLQGHAAANQSATGSAEGSVLPYFSEYKQEANNVKLQTAPTPTPCAALVLLPSQVPELTTSLKNISVCFGLGLHENLNTPGAWGEELCLFKDDLFLTAVIFNS